MARNVITQRRKRNKESTPDTIERKCFAATVTRKVTSKSAATRNDTRNKKKTSDSTKADAMDFGVFMISNSEFVLRVMQDDPNQVWILDNGASQNMCFYRVL